ncbi:MAG: YlxR family protein [Actinomycetota bacterium]
MSPTADGSPRPSPRSGSTRSSRPKRRATPKRGRTIDDLSATLPLASGPVRTCVGCRRRCGSDDLVRLTRDGAGRVTVGGPSSGRGVWLCRETARPCAALARRAGRVERGWRMRLTDADHEEIDRALRSMTTNEAATVAADGTGDARAHRWE